MKNPRACRVPPRPSGGTKIFSAPAAFKSRTCASRPNWFKVWIVGRLRASFEAFLPYYASKGFMEGCLLGNLGVDAADRSDLVRGSLQSAFKAWQTDLHALLAEADLAGDLPRGLDPAMTAAFLVNSWEGALVRMKVERSDEPLRCFFTIFDHLIMGQRPKSPIKTGRSKRGRRKPRFPGRPQTEGQRPVSTLSGRVSRNVSEKGSYFQSLKA